MSEFLLIWLVVMADSIKDMLSMIGKSFIVFVGVYLMVWLCYTITTSDNDFRDQDKADASFAKYRKFTIIMLFITAFVGGIGKIVPGTKEVAAIIGGGVTVKMLTSDEAKKIGGKSLEILNKKLDELIQGENIEDQTSNQTSNQTPNDKSI